MKKQYYLPRNLANSTVQNHSISQSMLSYHQSPTSRNIFPQHNSKPKYEELRTSFHRGNVSLYQPNFTNNSKPNINFHQSPTKDQSSQFQSDHRNFSKQNQRNLMNDQSSIQKLLKQLENKVKESEFKIHQHEIRIQKTERLTKNSQKIGLNIEQIMKMQLKDIKFNNQLQQRLQIIESDITHMKSLKDQRKEYRPGFQMKNDNLQEIQKKIDELIEHANQVQQQIQRINDRFVKTMQKVENSFVNMGKKYEQFIESNLIKTIQQMNRLSQHYHQEIQSFKKQNLKTVSQLDSFNLMIQSLSKKMEKDKILTESSIINLKLSMTKDREYKEKTNTARELIGTCIPNLRIVSSLKICKKQPVRQQVRYDFISNNYMQSLYSKIEQQTRQEETQFVFQNMTYKLDSQFYLLDENSLYIVDFNNNRIRLNNEQIQILEKNNMMTRKNNGMNYF